MNFHRRSLRFRLSPVVGCHIQDRRYLFYDLRVNSFQASLIAERQRVVAQIVDAARDATAELSDLFQGIGGEESSSRIARHAEPVMNVFDRLGYVQGFEPGDGCNPLAQLRQVGAREFLPQLRLSHEQDLDQLGLRGLEIRQQPDGFQHGFVQVLGLVNHQNKAAARQSFPGENLIQLLMQGDEILITSVHSQAAEQVAEQLSRIALRLKKKHGIARLPHALEELEDQRRLPHSGLGGKSQEAAAALDAVDQRQKRFPMRLAEI